MHEGDIQESLEVPSHSHQHLRIGDIQEEFELELAMRLSEDKNPPTKDESTMQIPSKTGKEDLIKKPESALSSAQNSHGYKTIYVTHYLVMCVQSYLEWFGLTQC